MVNTFIRFALPDTHSDPMDATNPATTSKNSRGCTKCVCQLKGWQFLLLCASLMQLKIKAGVKGEGLLRVERDVAGVGFNIPMVFELISEGVQLAEK